MDQTQQRILDIIDRNRERVIAFGRDIFEHAELGYKEYRTSERFAQELEALGLSPRRGLAITGVAADQACGRGPTVALIGELDALRIPNHAHANPETQAAHCCGHNAQLAGVFGAAIALTDPAVREALCGTVRLMGVPSEEFGEVAFKNSLVEQGKIRYGGGKCELIRVGAFDDVDLAVTHHLSDEGTVVGCGTSNAFVSKAIAYQGKAVHAAGPHEGVNALNAASLGLTALAYQRETWRDEDCVRVHPIMTRGGDLVNIVPDDVRIETLVRAKSLEALERVDAAVDRAFKAGAMAIGAGVTIATVPGYLSTLPLERLDALAEAARLADPGYTLADPEGHNAGSTDVGDLCQLMPVLQFNTGHALGHGHGVDYDPGDEDEAYVLTAKIFALTAYNLLRDGAAEARAVMDSYTPPMTKDQYLAYMERMMRTERIPMA
ncbi:MAG: amidohydrolase [Christensenellales bacterium]|jgi:amidohydrolase